MPPHAAHITSIEAVRLLRAALREFELDATNALVTLELEGRRPIEWLEHDRTLYWPREVRKASDAVAEARLALQRCELTIDAENRKYCYDERKALEKAKRRYELCESKVHAVKRWRLAVRKEVEDFEVQTSKLKRYLEFDLQQAVAKLERMAAALDAYVQTSAPPSSGGSSAVSPGDSA